MTDDEITSSAADFPLPSSVSVSKIEAGSGLTRAVCLQKNHTLMP
jgi:hypothetical protein